MPKIVSQDRIQQRTVEQTVDILDPQDVEEPAEFFKASSQNRVQQRFGGQIIEPPAISLAEKIVEVPVIQTQEKTQQGVNTNVQHVVDTVEVEKHIIQEKINQETKRIEVPPLQFMDKAVDIPVVAQRQTHMNQMVQKTIEISQLQHTDQVVDVPVVVIAQVPQVHVVMKTVETPRVQIVAETTKIPQLPLVEKIEMNPEIQTVQGPQTSESLSIEGTVAEKTDHGIVMQSVMPNIGLDSFIDDLSSVGSRGVGSPRLRGIVSCRQAKRQHTAAQKQEQRTEQAVQEGERDQREGGERSGRKRVCKKG